MQQEQYFKAVPVSEKPKQEGWITVITKEGKQSPYLYTGTDMSFITLREQYTHYLEPIQLPDAAVLRSALEKIANHDKEAETLFPSITVDMFKHIAREALSAGDGWVRVEDGLPEDWAKEVWAMSKSKGEVEKMKAGNLVKYQQYYSHWHPELIPSPPIK